MTSLLSVEPSNRLSAKGALEHKYFQDLHEDDDEPIAQPVSAFDFDFEKYSLKRDDFRKLLVQEIMLYHSG